MNLRRKCGWSRITTVAFSLLWAQAALGQTFSSGSTGADGALIRGSFGNETVRPGGVYNYTTVNISGSIRYLRNSDNAPVVILATGDVNISGSIIVDGSNGAGANSIFSGPTVGADGGPGGSNGGNGGFSGGSIPAAAVPPTAGHGPGGGAPSTGSGAQGGSYAAPTSFVTLTPLFGGSGGGGGQAAFVSTGGSGGGGAGAILIASSTRINITGQIRANGGNASGGSSGGCTAGGAAGAGGAIRLVAPVITGTGNLQAIRGALSCATTPSDGRIRLEAFAPLGFTGTTAPVASVASAPGAASPLGNPALVSVPTLTIASVGGQAVPSTTGASYFSPDLALAAGTANPVPVVLNATNTPVGGATAITLRLIPQSPGTATAIAIDPTAHTGTFASSSASASVTLPVGQVSVLQASAAMTLTGQTASLFPLIDGEPVERVMVAASPGEPSTVSLVTRSGKEVRVDELRDEERVRVALAWEVLRTTWVE